MLFVWPLVFEGKSFSSGTKLVNVEAFGAPSCQGSIVDVCLDCHILGESLVLKHLMVLECMPDVRADGSSWALGAELHGV